jgi:hypothetical protein
LSKKQKFWLIERQGGSRRKRVLESLKGLKDEVLGVSASKKPLRDATLLSTDDAIANLS